MEETCLICGVTRDDIETMLLHGKPDALSRLYEKKCQYSTKPGCLNLQGKLAIEKVLSQGWGNYHLQPDSAVTNIDVFQAES